MSFICSSCRSALKFGQVAKLRRLHRLLPLIPTTSPAVGRRYQNSASSKKKKYDEYAQDIDLSRFQNRPPRRQKPVDPPPQRPPLTFEEMTRGEPLKKPATTTTTTTAATAATAATTKAKWSKIPKIPGIGFEAEVIFPPRKDRPRAARQGVHEESIEDLERIYKLLSEDKSREATKAAYENFQAYQRKFGFARVPDMRGYLNHEAVFKLLMERVAQYHGSEVGFPNPRNLLDQYLQLGVDQDIHWADMMFGSLRMEDDEEVIAAWQEYMQGQKYKHQRARKKAAANDVEESVKWNHETKLCSVAAMTAFFRINARSLKVPTLADLIFQLKLGDKVGTSNLDLPTVKEIQSVMRSYSLPEKLVEATAEELVRLRPYSDVRDKDRVALMDQITYAGAVRDDIKLGDLYVDYMKTADPPRMMVFSAFINAFVQCNRMEAMSRVWSDMITSGQVPGIGAWGALLDGAAKSGDPLAFEETWAAMEKSEIPIDNVCWTIRTQFYYSIGEYDKGWEALKQMEARKVPINGITINAIISSLDSKDLYRESADLLRWALNKGINKDIVTYNLFIRAQMKEGLFKDASLTIDVMRKQGIEPDLVTYGSVVNGLFSKKNLRPPSMELISALLAEMEKLGMKPNLYFFNTLLNGVLTQYKDETAAKQILAMMPDESWKGSPVTSNILIQHYARKGDFDAVEVVWKNMTRYRNTPDVVVYASTVELYAKAGNASMAKFWLGRMMGARRKPSLTTFTKVLRCLCADGDFASAKKIIQDMQNLGVYVENNRYLNRVLSVIHSASMVGPTNVNQATIWKLLSAP